MSSGPIHRHTIFCILPPHIWNAMAQKGTPPQRAQALKALAVDHAIRSQRARASEIQGILPRPVAPAAAPAKQRTIYDEQQAETLPGAVVRGERDDLVGDVAVNEAYDGLGATYDFYWQIFNRNSVDDHGLPLNATVHFGQGYDNAFWNGEQMVFGDGDGQLFNRFTISLDVIGHELTHGVTQFTANLDYSGQSGALNESISDVFGSLIKQYKLQQPADVADWLIGAGLFTANVHGTALRSMQAPGTAYDDPTLGRDPQPADMAHFVQTEEDNGGVHINSGILNHAFYLVATKIGGNAWERAGQIWYETLRSPQLPRDASFLQFATLTAATAGTLFGQGSEEQRKVLASWQEVGIAVNGWGS
jgi:Zn-dependent metalloprotease